MSAMIEMPCPRCGRPQDPAKMKKKMLDPPAGLILPNQKQRDDGYWGQCQNCKAKYTFNTEYVEEILKRKKNSLSGFLVPKGTRKP